MNYWTLKKIIGRGLLGAITIASIATTVGAAPNNGGGSRPKTPSECRADYNACVKGCDGLIDYGDQIQRCRNKCQDQQVICLRVANGGTTKGDVKGQSGGVYAPVTPDTSRSVRPNAGGTLPTK